MDWRAPESGVTELGYVASRIVIVKQCSFPFLSNGLDLIHYKLVIFVSPEKLTWGEQSGLYDLF